MINLKNQRGFAVLEVILLVVVLGILGYVGYTAYQARQTKNVEPATTEKKVEKKDPYAGWKVYSNAEFGFTMQYPEEWKPKLEFFEGKLEYVKFLSDDFTEITFGQAQGRPKDGCYVWVRRSVSNGMDPEESIPPFAKRLPDVTIDGQTAVQTQIEGADAVYSINSLFIKGDYLYSIVYEYPPGESKTCISVYNKMLTSFEVVD